MGVGSVLFSWWNLLINEFFVCLIDDVIIVDDIVKGNIKVFSVRIVFFIVNFVNFVWVYFFKLLIKL